MHAASLLFEQDPYLKKPMEAARRVKSRFYSILSSRVLG
jgi:hypothetical protein